MDAGLIVIAIFVGLLVMVVWSWLSKRGRLFYTDHTRAQPGRRLEGSDHVGGGSDHGGGSD